MREFQTTEERLEDKSAWTWEDTALEAAFIIVGSIDRNQTMHMADHPDRYRELNPLLGEHPSRARINTAFFVGTAGHAAISYALPKPYRTWWQGMTLFIESSVVNSNNNLGLGCKIGF